MLAQNAERGMEARCETLPEEHGTVLIVDDDATIRLAFTEVLSLEGYRVVAAANADEARAQLDRIQPDVILCDLIMTGTSGDEFCSWLKDHETWRFVPVIAITRIDHPAALAGMLDAGADVVVVKPIGPGELRARVAAAWRTRSRYMDLMRRRPPINPVLQRPSR